MRVHEGSATSSRGRTRLPHLDFAGAKCATRTGKPSAPAGCVLLMVGPFDDDDEEDE
jgi:hypothetical protein